MKLGIIVFFVILTFAVSFDPWTLSINLIYFTYLLDIGSLVVVAVPTIAFAIGSYSWKTYVKTWSIPFGNPENNDQSELVEVNKCLNFLGNMSVMMGIIGTFIGVILLLNFLQQGVDLSRAIAIAVVTLFYGFLFKALFMFASSKVEKYIE
jgi:hypothetical protein